MTFPELGSILSVDHGDCGGIGWRVFIISEMGWKVSIICEMGYKVFGLSINCEGPGSILGVHVPLRVSVPGGGIPWLVLSVCVDRVP